MALTIGIDGTGVIADADDTTDNQGGSWGEDGGGTIYQNVDTYLYSGGDGTAGSQASIGSKYASKSGYTYYSDGTTTNYETNGEFIYYFVNIQSDGAFDALSTDPFRLIAGTDIGATDNLREYVISGKGDSNGWTGGWKCFVIDPQITAGIVATGTVSNAQAIDIYGIWIDTNVSVRAESIFISQIVAAKGIDCTGTATVTGDGFNELVDWCTDYANRLVGTLEKRGNTIFQKGGVTVGDGTTSTTLSAYGNSIECEESSFHNSSNVWVSTYPSDANYLITLANASVDFQNLSYTGYVSNKLQWDTSLGNASTITGGSLKVVGALSVKSSDVFNGVVFGDNDALSLGAASYDNCSFINCALQTITTSITSFSNNTFKGFTGTVALSASNCQTEIDSCTFFGDETTTPSHAVDFGSVTGGTVGSPKTFTWSSILDNGATNQSEWEGSTQIATVGPDTLNNDAAIKINVASGTYVKIAVASGATIPTVYNSGSGYVEISANEVTLTITVKDIDTGSIIEGAMVYVTNTAETATYINKVETNASGQVTDTRSLGSAQTLAGNIRAATPAAKAYTKYYKSAPVAGTYSNTADTDITIQMIPDE